HNSEAVMTDTLGWRLNFSESLNLAEASFREPSCTDYIPRTTHHLSPCRRGAVCTLAYVTTLHEEFETFQVFFRELFMLQNVYCVHVDVIQGTISLSAGSDTFSVPASFPGKESETCLASTLDWCYLLNTCGQDLSLKNSREITQLLKSLEGKNITLTVLPSLHATTYTKYVQREQFYSSFFFMLWTFCVLHLLAWPEDTNSLEGHLWMMPCRIPGDFLPLFFSLPSH
uniref:Uncharacterized protein n=1 Tax=Catharus ustulatus TaxID=91951 RepID=A0A8C3TNJ3_CATUS